MRKLIWGFPVTILVLIGLSVGLVAWNLHTYNRLTDEALIAKLRFVQIAPRHYQVELRSVAAGQGLLPRLGCFDLVPFRHEAFLERGADGGFVVDDIERIEIQLTDRREHQTILDGRQEDVGGRQ